MIGEQNQQDPTDYLIEHIYPPNPTTERGFSSSVSVSPDKSTMVYCSANCVIIRRFDNLNLCEYFDQHKWNTTACRFNSTGMWVASGDQKGDVKVWEIIKWKPSRKEYDDCCGGTVRDIAFTEDNQRMAVAGDSKQTPVKVMLYDTGVTIGDLSQMEKHGLTCDFKPQRPFRLITGGEDKQVYYYEGPPYKYKHHCKPHTNYVTLLRYNKKGEKVVSVSTDKTCSTYEGKTGNKLKSFTDEKDGHTGGITYCDWIDDDLFVTSSNDKSLVIWNSETEKVEKKFKISENPTLDDMQLGCGSILKNGLVSISLSGTLNLWSDWTALENGSFPTQKIYGHNCGITYLQFHKKTGWLISADEQGIIYIWKDKVATPVTGKKIEGAVQKFVMSADEDYIYLLGSIGDVHRVDIAKGTLDNSVSQDKKLVDIAASKCNNNIFYVLLEDGGIITYENFVQKDAFKIPFQTFTFNVTKDGETFVVSDKLGIIHLMDKTGAISDKLNDNHGKIQTRILFSKDDKWLITGNNTKNIHIWDFATKKDLSDKMGFHSAKVSDFKLNSSEKYLVSCGIDSTVLVWNTETFEREAHIIAAHKRGCLSCDFDDKGRIISGGGENLIKVWSKKGKVFD